MAEKTVSVQVPPLDDFLKVGAHFGHKTSRWNPKMEPYIYSERNGVHILDLVKTMKLLNEALVALSNYSDKGSILIVGTKGQAASIVKNVAEENGAFYVNTRWPGGLFTNFKMIKRSISKLIKMEEHLASGAEDLVKKEQLLLERDVNRLNRLYEGIKFMDKLPTAVIVVDSRLEKNAINEAKNAGVPVVALVDSNCDPTLIRYPIPANDDSIKSIGMFVELFGDAIAKGKSSERVVALRNTHMAKLETMRLEHAKEVELRVLQEEEERERMKKLRAGEEVIEEVAVLTAEEKAAKPKANVRVVQDDKGKKTVKKAAAKKPASKAKSKPKSKETAKPKGKSESKPIEELGLPTRSVNALTEAGITTTKKLEGMSKSDLMNLKGIGEVAAEKILKANK